MDLEKRHDVEPAMGDVNAHLRASGLQSEGIFPSAHDLRDLVHKPEYVGERFSTDVESRSTEPAESIPIP